MLEHAECYADGSGLNAPEFDEYSDAQVNYHIGLCAQAEFMHVQPEPRTMVDTQTRYHIVNLTWAGHEKLDEMRRNGIESTQEAAIV